MSDDLLLRIRAETLRLNLEKAHTLLQELPDLRASFAEIERRLEETSSEMRGIKTAIDAHENKFWELKMPGERQAMADVSRALGNLGDKIGEVQKEAKAFREKSFIKELCEPKERSIGGQIARYLKGRAEGLQNLVEQIQGDLQTASPDVAAWAKFRSAAEGANSNVFAESVELLGGIALRDVGFDFEICQRADDLIRPSYPELAGALRAIPGGVRTMARTLERIIGLRFPEWTLWALPFAAHEFWHVAARKELHSQLCGEIEAAGKKPEEFLEDPGIHLCLADAFATYTMGPAYAYAAVTLLFDPARPYEAIDQPACDNSRVRGILKMLDCMDEGASDMSSISSYSPVIDELENAWEAAKQQAAGPAEEEEHRRAEEEAGYIDWLVPAMWTALRGKDCAHFNLEQWAAIEKWPQHLLNGTLNKLKHLPGADLRQVLNAAWRARVSPSRGPDLDLKELTKRVEQLADQIKGKGAKAKRDARPVLRGMRRGGSRFISPASSAVSP